MHVRIYKSTLKKDLYVHKKQLNLLEDHELVILVFHITKLNGEQINIVLIVHGTTHHKYTRHEVNDNLICLKQKEIYLWAQISYL